MILGGLEVPLWAVLSASTAVLCFWALKPRNGTIAKNNLPGPKSLPFIGSLLETGIKGPIDAMRHVKEKYGNIAGVYESSAENLYISDPDFLREAYIRNFDKLTDRRMIRFGNSFDYGLFSVSGEHWKFVRTSLSPAFTSGKLKKLTPLLYGNAEKFVRNLKAKEGQSIEFRPPVYALMLANICTTAFGVDSGALDSEDNPYLVHGLNMITQFEGSGSTFEMLQAIFLIILQAILPAWTTNFLYEKFGIGLISKTDMDFFEDVVKQVLDDRSKQHGGHDFVQSLADKVVDVKKGDKDALFDKEGRLWTRKGLTKQQVVGNAILFLFAGFQTTADTFIWLLYEMAMNQECQEKLYEEVMRVCPEGEITPEQIAELGYMERFLNEAMRLYPQGFQFDRVATEDFECKGLKIDKGTYLTACGFNIMRDPEYWEEPDKFDPDRFLPEASADRHPLAFIPFGIGNRNCIGSRLALMNMKITLALLVRQLKVEPTSDTVTKPIKFKKAFAIVAEEPIKGKFVLRS